MSDRIKFLDWARDMAEKLPAAPMKMTVVDAEAAQVWNRLHKAEALLTSINDELHYAIQGDLENGVAWLNEEANVKFAKDYPRLCDVLNTVMSQITDLEIGEDGEC